LAPLFYLNFDRSKILVNQTQASMAYEGSLTLEDYRDGFRSIRTASLDVGAGVLGYWKYVDGATKSFLPYVGVLPMAGKSVLVNQYLKNKADIDQLPPVRVPQDSHDLDAWTVNDAMTFKTQGSVLFFGGIGVVPAAAQLMYTATGSWSIYIEKTAPTKALVKITKIKLQSLGVSAGTVMVTADVSLFAGRDDDFSYSFDLSDSDARKAFEDFVKGNLVPAEQMKDSSSSVKLTQVDHGKFVGAAAHVWLGLPFLFESESGFAKNFESSSSDNDVDGTHTDAIYSTYVEKRSTRALVTQHWQRTQAFTAASYRQTNAKKQVKTGLTGKIIWSDLNDDSDADHLRQAIADLVKATGMRQMNITVPDSEELGYAGVKFILDLPETTTTYLLQQAQETRAIQALSTNASSLVSQYFAAGKDVDGYCDIAQEKNAKTSSKNGASIPTCRKRIDGQTQAAVATMQNALAQMIASQNDPKAFIKAYRDFGHAMMTNGFAFQTALAMVDGYPVKISLRIEGEKIALYERTYSSQMNARLSIFNQ
jgi:hypothetical protein